MKPLEEKICRGECGELKSRSEFFVRKGGKISYMCKTCTKNNEATKRSSWSEEQKENKKETNKNWRIKNGRSANLKKQYGITQQDYDKMLAEQDGVCAICKEPPNEKFLSVDHCHKTGLIRGLLHRTCNTGIGNLKDDVKLLESATHYLRRFNEHCASA